MSSQLGVALRESVRTQREPRTILGLLREQMDGVDGGRMTRRRRRSFKERLGFIGIGCCGAHWGSHGQVEHIQQQEEEGTDPPADECVAPSTTAGSGMNLAAALAAERQLRGEEAVPGTPWRVSLMRLLEETEAGGETVVVAAEKEKKKEKGNGGGGVVGNDSVCCVCMGRNKGAAFIPCGHTFCRVCSRELWLNRGSCPLCNRSITEILDIF